MAYPKITVNTGIAIPVYAHDTIPIPNPNVTTITGTGTAVAAGSNDTITADKLENSTLSGVTLFTSTVAPLPIQVVAGIGDKVYNTTTPANALVDAVDSGTVLALTADIFLAQPETYIIIRPNHLIDTTASFTTAGASIGDIVYNTTANTAAYITYINDDKDLTLSADIFGSNTTYNDAYEIYLAGATGLRPGLQSAEGCLLYVSSSATMTAIADTYTNIQVITTAGDTVLFTNFPVGHYLPVQITHLMTTNTTDTSEAGVCIAIW